MAENREIEEIWEFLHELIEAYISIAKIVGARSKDQKELSDTYDLNAHLANLGYLFVRRKRRDPRGKVRKVIRDENGKIEGLEDMSYE